MGTHRAGSDRGAPSALELIAALVVLALAGASGALLFAVAEAGYSTFQQLGQAILLPAAAVLVLTGALAWARRWTYLRSGLITGAWMGAVATVGLEIVRIVGFRVFHSMPGSLPMLMGVLLTGRIMQGPDLVSNLAGWADHFWNGAMFGVVYVLILGRRPLWVGIVYGLVLGTGFLLSPVPAALGVGLFGSQFGPGFAITVYLAHGLFGGILGWLGLRYLPGRSAIWELLAPRRSEGNVGALTRGA